MSKSNWKQLLTDIACIPPLVLVYAAWVLVMLAVTIKDAYEEV